MSKDVRQQLEEAGALAGIFEVVKRWGGPRAWHGQPRQFA
jgi:hypothetical protein